MYDGFLGTRASLMLDVVFLAMFLVVPVLCWSIWIVKHRRAYALHKRVQLVLASVLLVAVVLFEGDIQLAKIMPEARDWRERAADSPHWRGGSLNGPVMISLGVHLVFAISTVVLWTWVIVAGLRKFPNPPRPNEHSRAHARLGTLAAVDMCLTAMSGWAFYWLAFAAT